MSKKKFPKTLYVRRLEVGTEDEYLGAYEDYRDCSENHDTVAVAVYELQSVRAVVNDSELID